jgi:AraC-like DNA-binding protein
VQYTIPTDREIAQKARELVLADLSIYDSLHSLSERVGTNSSKLKVIFPKYYGETLFVFSRRIRMEQAKILLQTTNYTIQTIAETVGYTEGNNFQAAFKTVVRCTPGAYRKQFQ